MFEIIIIWFAIEFLFLPVFFLICEIGRALERMIHSHKRGGHRYSGSYQSISNSNAGWQDDMIFQQQVNDENNRQFMQQMQQMQQMQDSQRAHEEAMKMATGIEFGGYNCDPNLNPGMDFSNDMCFGNGFGSFDGMNW